MATVKRGTAAILLVLAVGLLASCGGSGSTDKDAGKGPRVTDPGRVATSTPIQNATLFQIRGDQVSTNGSPLGTVTPVTGSGTTNRNYTVKSGDTCGAIATQFNVSVDDLLKANRAIDAGCLNLRAGDILRIPTPATPVTTTVSGGATPKPGSGKEYKVQANDTCDAIAKSYGVSVADLIARNGLDANCQKLQIGQVLKIP